MSRLFSHLLQSLKDFGHLWKFLYMFRNLCLCFVSSLKSWHSKKKISQLYLGKSQQVYNINYPRKFVQLNARLNSSITFSIQLLHIFLCHAHLFALLQYTGGAFPFTIGRIEHGFNVRPDLCAVENPFNPRSVCRFILIHNVHILFCLGQRLCLSALVNTS